MNRPFGKLRRPALSEGVGQAFTMWLALLALLGNIMLPTAVSIAFSLDEPSLALPGAGFCSALAGNGPGNGPGKAKPALLVQHCPLCMLQAAPLPRPPGLAVPTDIAEQQQFQFRAPVRVASIKRGGTQARAPPPTA